jgi:hypothetical protein
MYVTSFNFKTVSIFYNIIWLIYEDALTAEGI